jgi:hypothetical protein
VDAALKSFLSFSVVPNISASGIAINSSAVLHDIFMRGQVHGMDADLVSA